MPYTATAWVDNVTAANQTHMNNLETQYTEAINSFEQELFTAFVYSGLVATKDGSVATKLDVTAGVAFLLQADNTLRRRAPGTSNQTTSTPSATYYLYLQPDGTWYWNTANTPAANSLFVAQVATDGSGNILTVTDKRALNTTLLSSMLGTVAVPGKFAFGPAASGSQSALNFETPNVVYRTPEAGGAQLFHLFQVWNGSAPVNPFGIGTGVATAASVDNNGNYLTTGFLLFGPAVSASQAELFFNSGLHVAQISTPQAGASALGVSFGVWDGAAGHVPFSVGGQFNGAIAWVDNAGAVRGASVFDNGNRVAIQGAHSAGQPIVSYGTGVPGALATNEVYFQVA